MEKHFMLLSLIFSTLLLAQPAEAKELLPPGELDLGPRPHEPVDPSCSVHLSLANTQLPNCNSCGVRERVRASGGAVPPPL